MIPHTGGCLCGALRYEAHGEPMYAGYCYCRDCQRASGSAFIPFMGFAQGNVRFSGATRQFRARAARGGDAVRNSCPICASLVFGGELGRTDYFTIYAGTLDDPTLYGAPQVAIYAVDRQPFHMIAEGLPVHDRLPPR